MAGGGIDEGVALTFCDDADATIYPGAAERCDEKDDNCDGVVDEDLPEGCMSADDDGDGCTPAQNDCNVCERTVTGQTLKGKKYPARLILDGASYYNVGFSLEDTVRFLQQSCGLKVDLRTLADWVSEFEEIFRYGSMREYGLKLYSPSTTPLWRG